MQGDIQDAFEIDDTVLDCKVEALSGGLVRLDAKEERFLGLGVGDPNLLLAMSNTRDRRLSQIANFEISLDVDRSWKLRLTMGVVVSIAMMVSVAIAIATAIAIAAGIQVLGVVTSVIHDKKERQKER